MKHGEKHWRDILKKEEERGEGEESKTARLHISLELASAPTREKGSEQNLGPNLLVIMLHPDMDPGSTATSIMSKLVLIQERDDTGVASG